MRTKKEPKELRLKKIKNIISRKNYENLEKLCYAILNSKVENCTLSEMRELKKFKRSIKECLL